MSLVTGCLYNSNTHHHKYAENKLSETVLFVGIQYNSVLAAPLVNSSFSKVVSFLFPLAIYKTL